METINVLHVLHSINLGGGARAVRTVYKYAPKDMNIHVAAIFEKGEKYDEFSQICKNLFFANSDLETIRKYIIKNDIKIVHFHTRGIFNDFEIELAKTLKDSCNSFNSCNSCNSCKIVCTNIFGEFDKTTDNLVDFYIYKSFHAFSQKFAKYAKLDLQSLKNISSRYYVIPNPIDIDLFNSLKPSKQELKDYKRSLGIKQETEFVIGKIGARKTLEKWSDLLLYMFPYVLKRYPNTVMLLQGVPDNRLKRIKNNFGDKIIVLKATNEDKELILMYNIPDIITHASKIGEHSGNSINEAMFWSKPVISNLSPEKDNGQFEQIKHGDTGFFCNTPKLYAQNLCMLFDNKELRNKIGDNAKRFIETNNNPNLIAEQTLKVYRFLLFKDNIDLSFDQKVSTYLNSYANDMPILAKNTVFDYSLANISTMIYYKFLDYYTYKLRS